MFKVWFGFVSGKNVIREYKSFVFLHQEWLE